ncbi:MAG: hypothetical protein JWR77_2660 [Rhizorhabdus sp.]|nr:hypothetical protein [Rhizorhabdus sp.]
MRGAGSRRGKSQLNATIKALETQRGTIRTRKIPGQWRQTYQAGSPASWIRNGFVTVGGHCLTGACRHQTTVELATLPQDLTWAQIGRHTLCEECGGVGAVNFRQSIGSGMMGSPSRSSTTAAPRPIAPRPA